VFYTEVLQDFGKRERKIQAGMGLCDLDKVEEEAHWLAIVLEVNGDRNVGLIVRRCPRVGSEAESALVFLNTVSQSTGSYCTTDPNST